MRYSYGFIPIHGICVCCCLLMMFSACATNHNKTATETTEDLDRPVNEVKSFEIFNEIYMLSRSANDRRSVLPEMEARYQQIIRDYPETPLAQESYWRLIKIYVTDYSPPDYVKAEKHLSDFQEKYHNSPLQGVIEETLGMSYAKHGEWNRLLALSSPSFNEYRNKKNRSKASLMFMYAEANYQLGNIEQAKKAYSIVSDFFPELLVGRKSKSMIESLGKAEK